MACKVPLILFLSQSPCTASPFPCSTSDLSQWETNEVVQDVYKWRSPLILKEVAQHIQELPTVDQSEDASLPVRTPAYTSHVPKARILLYIVFGEIRNWHFHPGCQSFRGRGGRQSSKGRGSRILSIVRKCPCKITYIHSISNFYHDRVSISITHTIHKNTLKILLGVLNDL